jgi:methionyl-tRNA synthetase
MVGRYLNGRIPDRAEPTTLDAAGDEIVAAYQTAMDRHLLHEGADLTWKLVDRANGFVEERAPWTLAKEGRTAELEEALAALARALARITLLASPFMPTKTQSVWDALGMSGTVADMPWGYVERPPTGGAASRKPPPLFPKDDRQS